VLFACFVVEIRLTFGCGCAAPGASWSKFLVLLAAPLR